MTTFTEIKSRASVPLRLKLTGVVLPLLNNAGPAGRQAVEQREPWFSDIIRQLGYKY
jgi:hypothetical protein